RQGISRHCSRRRVLRWGQDDTETIKPLDLRIVENRDGHLAQRECCNRSKRQARRSAKQVGISGCPAVPQIPRPVPTHCSGVFPEPALCESCVPPRSLEATAERWECFVVPACLSAVAWRIGGPIRSSCSHRAPCDAAKTDASRCSSRIAAG